MPRPTLPRSVPLDARHARGDRDPGSALRGLLRELRAEAASSAEGKSALLRLPLIAYLAIGLTRHLLDPTYQTFLFGAVTFGVHELGHVIFAWGGRFLAIAGGSITQVAAPIAAAVVLRRQRDWFGVGVAGFWLAFSLFGLAAYIADARAEEMPLLGLSSEPEHDWHALLEMTGLLSLDQALAFVVRVVALVSGIGALVLDGWLCLRMARGASSPSP
jgi:hypothetical protein